MVKLFAVQVEFPLDMDGYSTLLGKLPQNRADRIKRFKRIEDTARAITAEAYA